MNPKPGPWDQKCPAYWPGREYVTTCDAQSRLERIKTSTDQDWLEAVVEYPHNQKTVQRAAELRLTWVKRAVAGLMKQARSTTETPRRGGGQ